MQAELLTPAIRRALQTLRERDMGLPVLLFVAGQQPLAFFLGQTLHLLAPVTTLCGISAAAEWATLLSHPRGAALLHAYLQEQIQRDGGVANPMGER
jgi:hypothetical protein